MQEQIQNLLSLKSLSAFNFDPRIRTKEYDLNELVMELEKLLPQCLRDGVDARIETAYGDLKVMADATKIKEAFVHLIKNANEAMPSGGTLTLKTSEAYLQDETGRDGDGCASGKCAFISIADTGSGMDESTRERMHEPFFTTKDGKERGLGFSVASRVIQQHQGSIKVESTPGIGTTVNVYLPLLRKDLFQASPIPLPSSFSGNGSQEYLNKPSRNEIFL